MNLRTPIIPLLHMLPNHLPLLTLTLAYNFPTVKCVDLMKFDEFLNFYFKKISYVQKMWK